MPKHVVLILRHFTVGGLERVLLSHVRLLTAAGHTLTVCVLDPGRDNVLVYELPPEVRLVTAPRSRLRRTVFLCRLVAGATVLLQFGDGRLYPSIRPALTSADRIIRFCHSDYSHLRTPAKNLLDRALTRSEDTIVAVGGRSTRFLLDDVHAPADKVITLTNAIEPRAAVQPPSDQPWAKGRPYVVAIQSLYPHKGHDVLLRAHAHLTRTNPDVQLVVIGDGDQTIALRALATSLGIADHVTWLGAVWHHDLVDRILTGASAFVSMSRFEGVPISVLEARRHVLPLVLTDIPGHRDAADPTTRLVTVDDHEAFAQAVLDTLTPGAPRSADTSALDLDWERYAAGFLAIVEGNRPVAATAGPPTGASA
ncbi:glycosyltransferase [Streptomyces goshikiensis]|uniref:glycosyltransferase n=1 Tax=Streptomyces goshikiensis TaxID=1942 RepID=UPI0036D116CA